MTTRTRLTVDQAISIVHKVLEYCSLEKIRLQAESKFERLILVKPKMYFGTVKEDGKLRTIVKGLSSRRKDRLKVAQDAMDAMATAICKFDNHRGKCLQIITRVYETLLDGSLKIRYCILESKIGSMTKHVYVDPEGDRVVVDPYKIDSHKFRVNRQWVLENVFKACDLILEASGLPPCRRMLEIARATRQ
jgi:DNA polymerase elongation subunit (family B)